MAEYILKNAGKRVIYLGASVPDSDVEKILSLTKIDYMLCVSILSQPIDSIQNVIDRFTSLGDKTKVLFGGRSFYHPDLKFPKSATVLHSFDDLATF